MMMPVDMGTPTKSTFALDVLWHERYSEGNRFAGWLGSHFAADRFREVTAGAGVRVTFRTLPRDSADPKLVDWERADTTAVVVLVTQDLVQDPESLLGVREVMREAERIGLSARVFPVMIGGSFPDDGLREQCIRWDEWSLECEKLREKLVRSLTHEFIRMLRYQLSKSSTPKDQDHLSNYLKKISVFLSHSKHDDDGKIIANQLRDWIDSHTALASFIDTRDLPSGLPFEEVIASSIQNGVLLAIRTDSYSSREWCCQEVLLAKEHRVPMIVIDSFQSREDRAFPYLGNVPTIRMDPSEKHRIEVVIGCLLDEIFLHYLWLCRTAALSNANPETLFLPRVPELASLSSLKQQGSQGATSIVYPDPPMMGAETRLFRAIRSDVTLCSFSQWDGGQSP